jgi:transposase InsO family protein
VPQILAPVCHKRHIGWICWRLAVTVVDYSFCRSTALVAIAQARPTATITYIRLRDEFVFLAVILDACSRCVIGWAFDGTLEDELTLGAFRMALARRVVEPGLVHHSDLAISPASPDRGACAYAPA